MQDITEQINSIPFSQIFSSLWIKTFNKWIWCKWLYEGQKKTDWWVYDEKTNLVNDFTWKRAKGDVISFLWQYLNLDFQEVLEYCKEKFWVKWEEKEYKPKEKTIDVKKIFAWLNTLNSNQIEYLKSRWIDYEKVKDVVKNNNWIACMIFNEKWTAISINTRSITEKRFNILAWTQSKWVYMWDIDKTNKKIYVVEWMFDFLTLRQFTKNVIWLKSINDWINVVREFFIKWYEIIVIPDNDEVWKTLLDKIQDMKYYLFDLSKYEVKDINDFLLESWFGSWIINIIEEEKEYSYKDPINNKSKPYTWWTQLADLKLSPIERNHYIIFWGAQGQWKTTFTFDVADKNSQLWHKVLYLSLEMETENLKTNMARSYAWISKEEWRNKDIPEAKKKAYFKRKTEIENKKNLILRWFWVWEVANTETIEKIILEINPDLVFIDNFDLIQENGWDKLQQQEKISKFFLNFTNLYKIPCVIIHHMKKGWNWINWLRWSWKITDDADLVLSWWRKEDAGNDEEKKLFIVSELKSRDWGSFETQSFIFEKWTFIDDKFLLADYKQWI